MNVLALPHGSPAVREYRFENASSRMGEVTLYDWYEDSPDGFEPTKKNKDFAEFLSRSGLTLWDVFWTSAYFDDFGAWRDLLKDGGTEIVGEVDDWYIDVPEGNISKESWYWTKKRQVDNYLKEVDRLVVSTPFLKDKLGGEIAPNFIVPECWGQEPRLRTDSTCTILCNGAVGRGGDFMAKAEAFKTFLAEPNTKIILMGAFPEWAFDYKPGKVVWVRWVPLKDYKRMTKWLNADIIVSPMEHNDFNLAKSNLKWLEAGACKSCFVGERWGEYERTVEDGVTGILADGIEEWTEKLVELARNEALRKKVAQAGQKEVYSKWTWPAVENQWRRAVMGANHGTDSSRDACSTGGRDRAAATS